MDHSAAELRLRLTRLVALHWRLGFSAAAVESEYGTLREICSEIDDDPALDTVLFWMWNFAWNQRSAAEAAEFTGRFAELARRHPSRTRSLEAHYTAGCSAWVAGRPVEALRHLDPCRDLYDPEEHRNLALSFGEDLGVGQHRWGAFVLWLLGYPNRAREHARRARRLADELGFPGEIARATSFVAGLHVLCGDVDRVRRYSDSLLEVSETHDLAMFSSLAVMYHGWADVQLGDHELGIQQARAGIADGEPEAHDGRVANSLFAANRHFFSWLLADALAVTGDVAGALDASHEALSIARCAGHLWLEAEEVRLVGELEVRGAFPDEGERTLLEAHAIAELQQAKSLELRCATSLARVRHARGETQRARALLAPTFDWFTEGHDTRDLRAAAQRAVRDRRLSPPSGGGSLRWSFVAVPFVASQ